MVQAYNFLASWQLFPEKGTYEYGERPKSGIYKIESAGEKQIRIEHNFISLENQGFNASFNLTADSELHPFEKKEMADEK